MGHRDSGTICDVILDKLLTNVLWLKNPKIEIPLTAIIAAQSQELFVRRGIWKRFYQILQDLKRGEKVTDEDLSMLFYHDHIENVLVGFDETEADKITQEFVLDEIEIVSKLKEEETERSIKEKEKEFLESLGKEIEKMEVEKDKEWLDKLQKIKKSTRESAEEDVKKNIKGTAEKKSKFQSFIYSAVISIARHNRIF